MREGNHPNTEHAEKEAEKARQAEPQAFIKIAADFVRGSESYGAATVRERVLWAAGGADPFERLRYGRYTAWR